MKYIIIRPPRHRSVSTQEIEAVQQALQAAARNDFNAIVLPVDWITEVDSAISDQIDAMRKHPKPETVQLIAEWISEA